MKKSTIIIIVLSVLALLVVLGIGTVIGAGFFFVKSIEKKLEARTVVVENLKTGDVTTIPIGASHGFPAVSPVSDNVLWVKGSDSTDILLLQNYSSNEVDTLFQANSTLLPVRIIGEDSYFFQTDDSLSTLCVFRGGENRVDTLSEPFRHDFNCKLSPNGKIVAKTAPGSTGFHELFLFFPEKNKSIEMTKSKSFLNQISTLCWVDSTHVAFISFLTIYVMNIETGSIDRELELSGLNNFTELFVNPADQKQIYLKARASEGDLSFQIYRINMTDGTCETWREGESMFTMGFAFSENGEKLIYTGNE